MAGGAVLMAAFAVGRVGACSRRTSLPVLRSTRTTNVFRADTDGAGANAPLSADIAAAAPPLAALRGEAAKIISASMKQIYTFLFAQGNLSPDAIVNIFSWKAEAGPAQLRLPDSCLWEGAAAAWAPTRLSCPLDRGRWRNKVPILSGKPPGTLPSSATRKNTLRSVCLSSPMQWREAAPWGESTPRCFIPKKTGTLSLPATCLVSRRIFCAP